MGQAKQKAISEKIGNQEVSLTLKRKELLVIYNILCSLQYRVGDAKIVLPLIDMINPLVAIDSNIDPDEEGPITN